MFTLFGVLIGILLSIVFMLVGFFVFTTQEIGIKRRINQRKSKAKQKGVVIEPTVPVEQLLDEFNEDETD